MKVGFKEKLEELDIDGEEYRILERLYLGWELDEMDNISRIHNQFSGFGKTYIWKSPIHDYPIHEDEIAVQRLVRERYLTTDLELTPKGVDVLIRVEG